MFTIPKIDQGKEENAKQLPDCSSFDKYFNNYHIYIYITIGSQIEA